MVGSELRCIMLHSDTVTDPPDVSQSDMVPHPEEDDLIEPTTSAIKSAVSTLGIGDAIV